MDYEVIWTENALASLEEGLDYLRLRNQPAAARIQQAIAEKAERLRTVPLIGKAFSQSKPDLREVLSGNYRIIYRVSVEVELVEILLIWHTSRQEPKL